MPLDGQFQGSSLYSLLSVGSSTATIVSANPAVLHTLSILVAGSTAAVVTVYDAATVATSDTTTDKFTFKGDAITSGNDMLLDGIFNTGIVIRNEGGTPGTYLLTWKRF